MRITYALSLLIFTILSTTVHALEMNYSIGARVGVGIGSSATNPFVGIDPTTSQHQSPIISRPQGLLSNHVNGSIMLYGDIGFVNWFALTPEVLFFCGNKTIIGDVASAPLELFEAQLTFLSFEIDALAKFRYGWLFFGFGPGLAITTAPKFKNNSTLQNRYRDQTRARIDFIMAVDIGLNVPVDKNRHHHVTFNVRASTNITGMVGLNQADKRWNQSEQQSKDFQIRGVTAVRGSFYLGYMYQF
ncbi:hypothetical protein PVA45_04395 [Entomospira entomophila]|uniref:Outer membrane protein beta-barrel domain-containing protein n=1 Tax=Entomospira entomophila TaxID=2719988 RepID=A0A968GA65_9SPIO|nr:hypothetical protein [Entomospira entomophilus]NIZ40747.1 hypothetical protein [Entomospira entomophilus]WDI34960.1 hypothetical protein PVA45_04395 [Entomospira entomophilus]